MGPKQSNRTVATGKRSKGIQHSTWKSTHLTPKLLATTESFGYSLYLILASKINFIKLISKRFA